jgi:hypothetical protein
VDASLPGSDLPSTRGRGSDISAIISRIIKSSSIPVGIPKSVNLVEAAASYVKPPEHIAWGHADG